MFLIFGANFDEWLHTNWQIAAVNQKWCFSVSKLYFRHHCLYLYPFPTATGEGRDTADTVSCVILAALALI